MRSGRRVVAVAGALVGLAVVGAAGVLGAGWYLGKPAPAVLGAAPADLSAETVAIGGGSRDSVRGWYAAGRPGHGVVLLLHPVRSNRSAMISRARFLQREGFGVLLIDLQAHGETEGEHITFGLRESRDAHAALAFLKGRSPDERTAVVGISLGGAAALLGATPLPVDAAVLEAVYPTIEEETSHRLRMRLGSVGAAATPLLTWQLPLWIGVEPHELRPVDAIRALRAPVLVVAGAEDRQTPLSESHRLFDAASGPKELWVVAGATHEDYYARERQAYESRVGGFLRMHLRGDDR